MKLYPSAHKVAESTQLTINQIPLAYIDTDTDSGIISIQQEEAAVENKPEERVWPFAAFDIPDPVLFNADGQPAGTVLEKQGMKYVYIPEGTIQFRPLYFTADTLVKKNLTYQTGRHYNLKAGASADTLENVASLMQLFGDAAKRGLCPENITVNDGSLQTSSLIDKSIQDCDVLFIESADGINIMANGEKTAIDYNALLNNNLIVWVFAENTPLLGTGGGTYSLANSNLFKENTYATEGYSSVANDTAALTQFPDSKILNLFVGQSPVSIIEKTGKGYIIFSQKSLLQAKYGKLFYEILMAVYFKAYHRTKSRQLWITNEPVDEIIGNAIAFNRRHPAYNIDEELANNDCLIDAYNIVAVNTNSNALAIDSIDKANNIFFVKSAGATVDPLKPNGMKSAYDNNGGILYYKNEALQILETGVPVISGKDDSGYYIEAGPCSSSSMKLFLEEKKKFYISTAEPHVLDVTDGILNCIPQDEYSNRQGSTKLATAEVFYKKEPAHLDVRIAGGGLPTYMEDDYNLMDISSYKGRPLRKGSVFIIKLPKNIEAYDGYIKEAVQAHAAAGSEITIIYE